MTTEARPLALYVHIPFCETKCPYCDFNTYAGIENMMTSYVDALVNEITQWGTMLEQPQVPTVFFGGGTPSYLPTTDLARLMATINASFNVSQGAEVTLEANPGDLTAEHLSGMREAGFNRLSIGVQSLDDGLLQILGRRHNAAQAKAAAVAARQAGFTNLSLDLMFGLPNQPVDVWRRTLEETLALEPDHLSVYGLTLEQGTPLEADVRLGRTPEPDVDVAADMYEMAVEMLPRAGYAQYEVSNWAKAGYRSRHNLTYWLSQPYLGVGPGAHSYLWGQAALGMDGHGMRLANVASPRAYMQRVRGWQVDTGDNAGDIAFAGAVETADEINAATAMREAMMMGLRLNDGVPDAEFSARFGRSIADAFPEALPECLEWGLITWESGSLRLTDSGRPLGNEVFMRFVTEPIA
jgi:oxygen-independent coproporphyrinogen-3 oxidase